MKPLDHKFQQWLNAAAPGQRYTYHEGFLLQDRWHRHWAPGVGYIQGVATEPLSSIANAAWKAHDEGKVALTQTRIADGKYLYQAVRL